MKHVLTAVIVLAIMFGFTALNDRKEASNPLGLAVCNVTESVVTVGADISSTIKSAGSSSWTVIQQPVNATNTVSLSFGGTAVSGQGYTLYPTVTGSTTDNLRLGFSTDLPTSVAVTGITNTGSSTLNVITCR